MLFKLQITSAINDNIEELLKFQFILSSEYKNLENPFTESTSDAAVYRRRTNTSST
jgi:hypothetical protein